MHRTRILVVEDEPVTRLMIEARLRAAGHVVQSVPSGEAALELLETRVFALLLTDLYLDELSGVELIARARSLDADLAVIVLTGGATVDSVIAAFDHGAFAYLRKPVAPGELEQTVAGALARRRQQCERAEALLQIGAALRQIAEPTRPVYSVVPPQEAAICLGDLTIEPASRRVAIDGATVDLSAGVYELLIFLARRPDVVLSVEELARGVLGYSCSVHEARDLIKVRIHKLRQKIEPDPTQPTRLVCVRGAGYMLCSNACAR